MTRFEILIGRMRKMEILQCKLVNLREGNIMGEVTPEMWEKFRSQKFREHLTRKINKAESIKLKISIAIYDDLQTP